MSDSKKIRFHLGYTMEDLVEHVASLEERVQELEERDRAQTDIPDHWRKSDE